MPLCGHADWSLDCFCCVNRCGVARGPQRKGTRTLPEPERLMISYPPFVRLRLYITEIASQKRRGRNWGTGTCENFGLTVQERPSAPTCNSNSFDAWVDFFTRSRPVCPRPHARVGVNVDAIAPIDQRGDAKEILYALENQSPILPVAG
jgi:hypothetical protein